MTHIKTNKNHLHCCCTLCQQVTTVQSLGEHIKYKHESAVRDKMAKIQILKSFDPQDIITAYEKAKSVLGTLKLFGLTNTPQMREYVIQVIGDKHNACGKNKYITRGDFESRIDEVKQKASTCPSVSSLLHALGIVRFNHQHFTNIKSLLQKYDITLAPKVYRYSDKVVYCQKSTYPRNGLRSRVEKDNFMKYECAECRITTEWNNKKLRLQVDHKNGINDDHRKENLRWLCPNCHSQTVTFCRKTR